MRYAQVISAQADICIILLKQRSDGRSQNYMPPEAKDALKKAAAVAPVAK